MRDGGGAAGPRAGRDPITGVARLCVRGTAGWAAEAQERYRRPRRSEGGSAQKRWGLFEGGSQRSALNIARAASMAAACRGGVARSARRSLPARKVVERGDQVGLGGGARPKARERGGCVSPHLVADAPAALLSSCPLICGESRAFDVGSTSPGTPYILYRPPLPPRRYRSRYRGSGRTTSSLAMLYGHQLRRPQRRGPIPPQRPFVKYAMDAGAANREDFTVLDVGLVTF